MELNLCFFFLVVLISGKQIWLLVVVVSLKLIKTGALGVLRFKDKSLRV